MSQADVQGFVNFINRLKKGAEKALLEYKGNQEPSNKIMAAYYHSKIAAYRETIDWFYWHCEIVPSLEAGSSET